MAAKWRSNRGQVAGKWSEKENKEKKWPKFEAADGIGEGIGWNLTGFD